MIEATVIVAAWRAETQLARSVGSALAQEDVALEVIVVDDASPDGTLAVAEGLARQDPRVRVLRQAVNAGPAAARNAGIDAAKGAWLAVLDADDAMVPDRLARMIALGESHGADAVYDDLQPVDEAGARIGGPYLGGPEAPPAGLWDLGTFLAGCSGRAGRPSLGYLKPVLRADFLRREGLRYDESLRNGEDFHLMAELLARGGTLWFTPEPGYDYTTRAGSISSRLDPDHARALAVADAAFLRRHGAAIAPEAAEMLRVRGIRLADLAAAEAAIAALRAGRPLGAVKPLLDRPRAMGRLVRQLGAAARRRLS